VLGLAVVVLRLFHLLEELAAEEERAVVTALRLGQPGKGEVVEPGQDDDLGDFRQQVAVEQEEHDLLRRGETAPGDVEPRPRRRVLGP
jgi:hypothetical protein